MTISIDCRWLGSSGIGSYIEGCLPYLINSDNNFNLICNSPVLNDLYSEKSNVQFLNCRYSPFSFNDLFLFPGKLLKIINKGDIYFTPFFNIPFGIKVPVYTTIHDMIFPDMPDLTSRMGLVLRMIFYRRAFGRSKKIFTVSEFSKSRIEFYSRKKKPVVTTHSALSPKILKFKNTNYEKTNTIVFIGNIKKHKGIDYLLDAFHFAKTMGLPHKLIVIGSKDNFRSSNDDLIFRLGSFEDNTVEFTGPVSNEELYWILSKAKLLVQPSLYEGFGLPPLEAMALGTRTLISDIPVLKEIYRDFPVVFFKAGDSDDLCAKMMEILTNTDQPELALSNEQLTKYSFEKTAGIILGEFK